MRTVHLPIKVPGIEAPSCDDHGFGFVPVKIEGGRYRIEPWSLWDVSFAVPNGVHLAGSSKSRGRHMNALKSRGLKPGVSDIVVAYPAGGFHGLFVEMKRDEKSPVAQDQIEFQELMRAVGYQAVIARGFNQARDAIYDYITEASL